MLSFFDIFSPATTTSGFRSLEVPTSEALGRALALVGARTFLHRLLQVAAEESELQAAVELDSQVLVLAVTHRE